MSSIRPSAPAALSERSADSGATRDANAINLAWLLRLRWVAICGQVITIVAVELLLGIGLPWLPILGIVALEVASNVACAVWARRAAAISDWQIWLLMVLDILLLTALLYLSGGPVNPFSVLYLINVTLAAVVLPRAWAWGMAAFAIASFGALFLAGRPGSEMDHAAHLRMHLEGMWVAFAVAAGFIVYFVQHVTRALASRERELEGARARTARHEKLASLATLAAGAAHQLATPLSTIAVVAGELEQQLDREASSADTIEDVRLIRDQVQRCRDILIQMAADAGESTGEPIVAAPVTEVIDLALAGLSPAANVAVENLAGARTIVAPRRSIAQALRALLRNAMDASVNGEAVRLRVSADAQRWCFEVSDRGHGMSPDTLQHAGEPFFTTKGPDRGMGLGLFLVRTVVERLGGELDLSSAPASGTTARLRLPVDLSATIRKAPAGVTGATR